MGLSDLRFVFVFCWLSKPSILVSTLHFPSPNNLNHTYYLFTLTTPKKLCDWKAMCSLQVRSRFRVPTNPCMFGHFASLCVTVYVMVAIAPIGCRMVHVASMRRRKFLLSQSRAFSAVCLASQPSLRYKYRTCPLKMTKSLGQLAISRL